jgi:ADP-ribosyl-[dinitrogen reductase] hydrolase
MAAAEIDIARAPALEPTRGWAKGATSDDTALTLLVADHLVSTGHAAGGEFMERLAADAPSIRGLGPSTTQAIAAYRAGDPPSGGGNTNGALMRAFPIGWAVPLDRAEERRTWTTELSHVTHPGAEACCAAWVGAACAAWALEGAAPPLIIEIAREEAAAAVAQLGADARIEDTLSAIAAGTWMPSPDAADLDPYETLARVLWCTVTEPDLRAAIIAAVRLGGDTDTVAALVAGLLGCRLPAHAVRGQLEWQTDVQLPEDALITRLATGLAGLRVSGRDG